MSDEHLAVSIRDAFDITHVPSPGLEPRVISAIPWDAPGYRSSSAPRLAGAFAAGLAIFIVVILVAPTILNRMNILRPGAGGADAPAYSLAAVNGSSLFVVQRTGGNVLLRSQDGGRSWSDLLHFAGIYDGMQMFGAGGFIWTIDMTPSNCTTGKACTTPPSYSLSAYNTANGGATWVALPASTFPTEDAYFLDQRQGWAVSGSPVTGLSNEILYETSDGGKTWSPVGPLPASSPSSHVFGVGSYFVTFSRLTDISLLGWYLGASRLWMTTDGGHSWKAVSLSVPAAVAGFAATPMQPVFQGAEGVLPVAYRDPKGPDNATGNRVYLYVSHDGGLSWDNPRPAPAGVQPVGDDLAISVFGSQNFWLTSQSLSGGDNVQAKPAVARTSNGGLDWTIIRNTPRILQMTFVDATHGFALDVTGGQNTNGILSTSDGGTTWQRVTVPLFAATP